MQYARSQGVDGPDLPPLSAMTVTVPGAPALWEDVVKKYGSMPLDQAISSTHY